MDFEWDAVKASSNLAKHGVSFAEARTIPDPMHSGMESRFVSIGLSEVGSLLVVVYAEREGQIRIVSAREAAPKERRQYESTDRF